MKRPVGVTLLGAFFAAGAVMCSLSIITLAAPGGPLEPMWRIDPHKCEALVSAGGWGITAALIAYLRMRPIAGLQAMDVLARARRYPEPLSPPVGGRAISRPRCGRRGHVVPGPKERTVYQ